MNSKRLNMYYPFACLSVLAMSFYPLYMGIRVICDMIANGTVLKENYPKYIIPYTPISLALLLGVFLMPLFMKLFKRYAFLGGAAVSTGTFFIIEMLFERKVVITAS